MCFKCLLACISLFVWFFEKAMTIEKFLIFISLTDKDECSLDHQNFQNSLIDLFSTPSQEQQSVLGIFRHTEARLKS
ncbi:hypothetical protein Sjap_021774 [Stephania japonica]|uniref:Secreted protein n=1 Tax=Stephania japonica TaxID=461633 RepID=A0AAP0EQR5_9MAGN